MKTSLSAVVKVWFGWPPFLFSRVTPSHGCLCFQVIPRLAALSVHTRFAFWPASQCKSSWVTACERGIQAQFIFSSNPLEMTEKWAVKGWSVVKNVFLCRLKQQQQEYLRCSFGRSTETHSWLGLHGGRWDNIFTHEGFSLVTSGIQGLSFNYSVPTCMNGVSRMSGLNFCGTCHYLLASPFFSYFLFVCLLSSLNDRK